MWFGGLWGEDDAEHAGAPALASSSPSLRQQQASNQGEGETKSAKKGASWFRSSPMMMMMMTKKKPSARPPDDHQKALCVRIIQYRNPENSSTVTPLDREKRGLIVDNFQMTEKSKG